MFTYDLYNYILNRGIWFSRLPTFCMALQPIEQSDCERWDGMTTISYIQYILARAFEQAKPQELVDEAMNKIKASSKGQSTTSPNQKPTSSGTSNRTTPFDNTKCISFEFERDSKRCFWSREKWRSDERCKAKWLGVITAGGEEDGREIQAQRAWERGRKWGEHGDISLHALEGNHENNPAKIKGSVKGKPPSFMDAQTAMSSGCGCKWQHALSQNVRALPLSGRCRTKCFQAELRLLDSRICNMVLGLRIRWPVISPWHLTLRDYDFWKRWGNNRTTRS